MLGGGAGHIADMISRIKGNQALQQRRKARRDNQLNKHTTTNKTILTFKTLSEEERLKFREKMKKKRRVELFVFVMLLGIVLGIVFWLFMEVMV